MREIPIAAARRELSAVRAFAKEVEAAAARGLAALSAAEEAEGVELPPVDPIIAAHRVGRPSRIDRDPELEAFILARIDRMTFADVAAQVAGAFPPERRVSRSGLHRWWHRRCAIARRSGA